MHDPKGGFSGSAGDVTLRLNVPGSIRFAGHQCRTAGGLYYQAPTCCCVKTKAAGTFNHALHQQKVISRTATRDCIYCVKLTFFTDPNVAADTVKYASALLR